MANEVRNARGEMQVAATDLSRLGGSVSRRCLNHLPFCAKRFQKRFALVPKLLFKFRCAIAVAAGPGFGPVFVTAVPPGMGIFHAQEIKVFLPIRSFFGQRGIAETSLDPSGNAIRVQARLVHIVNVFVTRD